MSAMDNPILLHMPEETPMRPILEAMGFEIQFDELCGKDNEEAQALESLYDEGGDADEVLERWTPDPPEEPGYELLGKWDTEHGPLALFVKPVTEWATRILALSKVFMLEREGPSA